MAHSHRSITTHDIPDDPDLKVSFGDHVPQPDMVKGAAVIFGELAGSTTSAKSLSPSRICFDDSIADNRRNQPKSH